jgi:2-polyprenyl-3-methyl-5-hydroxy-6-metoxy-1,4-benzoquinol methylase
MPKAYLGADPRRGDLLLQLLDSCSLDDPSILEVGCNVGRNLECLRQAGYTRLAGIEINQDAIDLLQRQFPQLAETASITISPVEEAIVKLNKSSFDVVFSMAVLVHIHTDSDWVFAEMARVARRNIITIEDELNCTERHFKRNYKTIFEAHGFRQLNERDCKDIEGLDASYTARVFARIGQ